jgi:ribokinase/sulfofructose kinase
MQFPFQTISDREFDAVGFGTNAVDFLVEVPEYPAFNSKVELNQYTQLAGGEVASTMVGLRRLGLRTAYAGRFGDDISGDFGVRSLMDDGVDIGKVERVTDARTQIAFIIIDARNGERTVIWKRDKKLSYTAEDAPVDIVSRASVLHLTPHDPAAAIAMAMEAKRHGTIVSIDVDNVFDGIENLLPLVDILIASAEFAKRLLNVSDHRKSLTELSSRYGAQVCGVTLGASGSLLYAGGNFIESKGHEVPGGCKDTTGAGDAFRVGIIYGLLKGESIEEAANYANAIAALKCRAVGARTSLPTENELTAFLGS